MNAIAGILLKALTSVAMSLVTEKFIIRLVVIIAEKLVKSTKNDLDDKLLLEVKKALGQNE